MSDSTPGPPAPCDPGEFGSWIRGFLEDVENSNQAVVAAVVERAVECVRNDRLIHTFGTGHSSGIVLETFYRAGGLACINPIVHPMYVPLLGGKVSTVVERTDGAATTLAEGYDLHPDDLGFIFSTSGRNPGPVEMATAMRQAGVFVIGVGSRQATEAAPARSASSLVDLSDVYWDTGVPAGDAAFRSGMRPVAPVSSLSSIQLWSLFLAHLATRCEAEGIELPVWGSANAPGPDPADLHERYRRRVPGL